MFYVIEIQENNGTPAVLAVAMEHKNLALSKYHEVLMYAAQSKLQYHTCMLCDERGNVIEKECFEYFVEPGSTPVEETRKGKGPEMESVLEEGDKK